MAESASHAEASAAELLRQKHAEHLGSHHTTVQEVPDEEFTHHGSDSARPDGGSTADGSSSWGPTMSAKAAGKQKADAPASSARLDTGSHELFPELGGPKAKADAGVAPVWSAKAVVNGKQNGKENGKPNGKDVPNGSSADIPAANGPRRAAPAMTIPGRNAESIYLDQQHVLPRNQLKRPLPDIIKDLNRKSRANVTMTPVGNGKYKFDATGPQEIAQQALRDLVQQIGTKQSIKVPIPNTARAHVIGKGGSTIKSLQEKTGARIQLPKAEEGQLAAEDDEDGMTYVIVEGNALSAASARDAILKIASERSAGVNTRLKGIPAEFYPFIAGPRNSLVNGLEEDRGVQIRIPPHQGWSSQPPPAVPPAGQRPVFVPPSNDNHIQLAGDRAAVQAARAEIERRAEELHRQLELEQLSIQRGRHQFIIGDRGVPMDDFFEETGCTVIFPVDDDDDMVTIIGPPDRLSSGSERAMDLAMNMQCSNIDISRFHRQAPGGASTHARRLTRYLRQKKEIDNLEKLYNVHINTPFSEDGVLPWELYSRDGKNAIRAQSEIKGIVEGHPPSRISTVAVDPFFHQHLRSDISPRVRQDYGVQLVVPDASDPEALVLLVYEAPSAADAQYQVPRSQPSNAEIRAFAQGLRDAEQHILDLINKQENIKSESMDVPQKFHDKLRKFIRKEQEKRDPTQIPVRVSALGTTVTVKGPASAVDSLLQRARAFIEQEKEDEKERGFTLEFEFPQKFANHLIGKGGSNIRELREKFDVDIQVHDGKVELKGPKAKAEAAKSHITALSKQLADETTHVLKIDPKFHRELIGPQGGQINRLQTRYKVLIFFPRSAKSPKDDESTADAASEAGKPRRQQAPDEVIVRGPKKGADEARDEILSLLQYLRDNSFTATVSVQQKQLPSLIGSGGAGMEQLRQTTGARIDIPNGRDSADTVVEIQVKGTKAQVAAAKKILEEKKVVFEDTVVKTVEVDRKYHKALIGTGGSNLRDIVLKAGGSDDRRELARTVQFPKQESDGNTIKVEGRSDVVEKIIKQMTAIVSERESQVSEVVEVPVDKHRTLIGRGGDTKRQLETQFHVSIDIPRQGSGQTGVRIAGQPADVEKAREHILSLVKAQHGETVQVPRRLHHTVANGGQFFRKLRGEHHVTVDHAGATLPPKPAAPTGAGGSGGSSSLPLITDEGGPAADAHSWNVVEPPASGDDAANDGEDIPWVLRGSPENVAKARKAVEAAVAQAKDNGVATGYLTLADPGTYRFVIGPGGSRVNAIREQSGCRINVPRSEQKDGAAAIEVVGTREGVDKARDLILAAVRDGVSGKGRAGGQ